MAKFVDNLRALAIASQAIGFIMIILLETSLGDAARPWQGTTLAIMLAVALGIAVMRQYRHNRARKTRARQARQEEPEAGNGMD